MSETEAIKETMNEATGNTPCSPPTSPTTPVEQSDPINDEKQSDQYAILMKKISELTNRIETLESYQKFQIQISERGKFIPSISNTSDETKHIVKINAEGVYGIEVTGIIAYRFDIKAPINNINIIRTVTPLDATAHYFAFIEFLHETGNDRHSTTAKIDYTFNHLKNGIKDKYHIKCPHTYNSKITGLTLYKVNSILPFGNYGGMTIVESDGIYTD